jgi:hypothetical protein
LGLGGGLEAGVSVGPTTAFAAEGEK